jgi:hypothetical protein
MVWIDRLEKLGRLFLWLAIASVLVGVPIALAQQRRGEAELREALQKAEAQLAEALKPKKPVRLSDSFDGVTRWGDNDRCLLRWTGGKVARCPE